MPVMSALEGAFCRTAPWRYVARRMVLPWALDGHALRGQVLEIGGGSGSMAAGVANSFPEVRLTVTDVDHAMVDAARARLRDYPNVNVEAADVTALPYQAEAFDAVTSYLMLHHVIDWRPALTELVRVLKPGGALIGYDLTETRSARWIHKLDRSPHRLLSPTELDRGLAGTGFTDISVRPAVAGQLMRFSARKPSS